MMEDASAYHSNTYRTPDGAPADIVIFTEIDKELHVLLIKRKYPPFEGMWALPGGFSNENESIYESAKRELYEETGVDEIRLEYFNVYSEPGRDPRGWMISHAFYALASESQLQKRRAADDAADVRLFSVNEALNQIDMAFDHRTILQDACSKLYNNLLFTKMKQDYPLYEDLTLMDLLQHK